MPRLTIPVVFAKLLLFSLRAIFPLAEGEAKTMAKYLDPKAELTFKKAWGEHKHLVKSSLGALLPLDKGNKIKSIEYLPSELTPRAHH